MRHNWNRNWNKFLSVSDKFISKFVAKWLFIKVLVDFALFLYRDETIRLKFHLQLVTKQLYENLLQGSCKESSSISDSVLASLQNFCFSFFEFYSETNFSCQSPSPNFLNPNDVVLKLEYEDALTLSTIWYLSREGEKLSHQLASIQQGFGHPTSTSHHAML